MNSSLAFRAPRLLLVVVASFLPSSAVAQVNVGSPFGNAGSSFHSGVGVGFGFNLRGSPLARADDSGPSQTIGLSAGGFTPNGDLQFRQGGGGGNFGGGGNNFAGGGDNFAGGGGFGFGFGLHGGAGDAFFGVTGGQGSTRGLSAMSSSVTVMNGHNGYFGAGTLQPFVTGVIPIVGDQPNVGAVFPMTPQFSGAGRSVLGERLSRLEAGGEALGGTYGDATRREAPAHEQAGEPVADASTAAAPAASLAEIRRQATNASAGLQREIAEQIAKGEAAEAQGQFALALHHYRAAHRRAAGETQQSIAQWIENVNRKRAAPR